MAQQRYWIGTVPERDDFGNKLGDVFIDGSTIMGPWAIMTPETWARVGRGQLGTGIGQKYQRQADGRWLKVEG